MNSYQTDLIEEHSNLVVRAQKLHDYIYSDASDNDNRIEFANKCIQLRAMKNYEEALRARLENAQVVFENGKYFENVATIEKVIVPSAIEGQGSDFDADSKTASQNE